MEQVYEFVGVRELRRIDESNENGSEEVTCYTVFLKTQGGGICKVEFDNHYSDCYSGYCGAHRGSMSNVEAHHDPIGALHYTLKPDVDKHIRLIRVRDLSERVYEKYGYNDFLLESLDGTVLVRCSEDGGDSYYPSGGSSLNTEALVSTPRAVDKRPVYVLSGDSKTGKSFLASHLSDLSVYETDSGDVIPDDVGKHHVIVVGNRVPGHLQSVLATLARNTQEIEVVRVAFARAL